MCLTFFLPIVLNLYLQQKREINPRKKDAIAWIVVIKYLKSSGDDLLLQKSFSDLGDHIFETKNDENVAILD